ncbi:MAG: TonB-dependent receptor [Flavihumibacter sp.]
MLGLNLAAEGPFSKNYKGSYLINYRYSTLQLLGKMGLAIGSGSTDFQDLSYHIYLPLTARQQLSLFGFNGSSGQNYDPEKDESKWESDFDRYSSVYSSRTSANGITLQFRGGDNWTLKTGIAYSVSGNKYDEWYAQTADSMVNSNQEKYNTRKWTMNSVLNYKISARHALRAGLIFTRIGFDYRLTSPDHAGDVPEERINMTDHTYTLQGFGQWRWQAGKQWLITGGLHYMELLLNNSRSVEPRVAIRWEASRKNSFSVGYGLHSQVQPLGVYFAKTMEADNQWLYPNKKLGLTRAHHAVISYTRSFEHGYRLRTEAYYQRLFDVPVSTYDTSSFSTLNMLQGFVTDPLTNKGKGKNYGLEVSLEKQLRRNFYLLWSNSVYQSRYTAADGIERNTRFNGHYASTLTTGKEFAHPGNKPAFGVNLKLIYMGGFRETPIDLEASKQNGYTVYHEQKAYSLQLPAYYRADLRVSMKWNRRQHTSTLSLDVQNLTNHLNRWGRGYDAYTGQVKEYYMTGITPVLNYKIEF